MAIIKKSGDDQKIEIEVNNGDLQALKQIIKDWGFADEAKALRFGIAVLVKASTGGKNKVYIDENGDKVSLVPGEGLVESSIAVPSQESDETSDGNN